MDGYQILEYKKYTSMFVFTVRLDNSLYLYLSLNLLVYLLVSLFLSLSFFIYFLPVCPTHQIVHVIPLFNKQSHAEYVESRRIQGFSEH